MKIPPPLPITSRALVTQDQQILTITIPARKDASKMGFVTIWLILWFIAGLFAISYLASDTTTTSDKAKIVIWVIFWVLGIFAVIYHICWVSLGREMILIDENFLYKQKIIGFFKRKKAYDLKYISHLEINKNQAIDTNKKSFKEYMGQYTNRGKIMFDYEGESIKIADEVAFEEAEHLLTLIETTISPK